MAKRWKKQDQTYLKRYARKRTLEELAERFGTTEAEVRSALTELGLGAADWAPPVGLEDDPLVPVYERGLKAAHHNRWKDAERYFSRVVDETETPDLASRARQYLKVCRQHLKPAPAKGEPYLQAVVAKNRGNLEAALELCGKGGRVGKDDRFAYLAASIHSLQGEHERAGELLSTAIDLNPKNRIHAIHDSDFESLREDAEYAELFAGE